MRHTKFIAIIGLLTILAGCDESKPTIGQALPTPILVENCRISDEATANTLELDSDVVISVGFSRECSGEQEEPIMFAIGQVSAREYSSSGLSIRNKIVVAPGTIEIEVFDVQTRSIVSPAFDEARTLSRFDMPIGAYSLVLVKGAQIDKYEIVLTDSDAKLTALSTSFTQLGNSFAER